MINDANRNWWILAATAGTLGLVVLDETIVGAVLPTIREDLAVSMVASHWTVSAYLVVFAGLAAAAGKAGDYRTVFLAAGVLAMAVLIVARFTVERPETAGKIHEDPDGLA